MIAIEKLSRAEKLRMMEALWRDLSANADELVSPAWHRDALLQAESAVTADKAVMTAWSEAKDTLRQRARS